MSWVKQKSLIVIQEFLSKLFILTTGSKSNYFSLTTPVVKDNSLPEVSSTMRELAERSLIGTYLYS